MIDTHTHLESFARQGTLPAVLARARAAGVQSMITIGTGSDDWALYRDLAEQHAGDGFVRHTVGLHPCAVDENWAREVEQIEAHWQGRRPVALGECGLDRFHLPKDAAAADRIFGWQKAAFAAQLEIVKSRSCPVVVHSRGAFAECVAMIDESGVDWSRVVFHCFTEGEAEMAELVRRGGVGSFTGILTYKTATAVRAAARVQGLDRLMLETDAPYLTPMPHRGKPNEPAFVCCTADFAAAEVFGVPLAELVRVTTENARRFFSL